MTDIRAAIKLIGGIEPTPVQVQHVQAIAHSLGIQNNDPMLPILIALDAYHGAFSLLPEKAQRAANAAAESAERQAKLTVAQAIQQAIANDLRPAVSAALDAVAHEVAGKKMFQWAAGSMIAAAICITFSGWLAYHAGLKTGESTGYRNAANEKAAASWANTPQGQQAYRLAQVGSLDALVKCNRPGWMEKKGNCYPKAASDGVYGWKL